MASMSPELASAIVDVARRNKWDPVHLGTVISYETAGSFDPWKAGPTTQWGQHRGLIQWGEPQAKQYGVTKDTSITDQMLAVEKYLKDRGLKEGAGLMDMYSTINAGAPGLYNRSDANNGGAPGTVADKVNSQMGDHRVRAEELLGMKAPVGQLATGPATEVGSSTPATAPVGELAAAVPSMSDQLANLGSKLGGGQGGGQPAAPDFLPLQQLQMAQPGGGQSAQIAAAIARAYGIGV